MDCFLKVDFFSEKGTLNPCSATEGYFSISLWRRLSLGFWNMQERLQRIDNECMNSIEAQSSCKVLIDSYVMII